MVDPKVLEIEGDLRYDSFYMLITSIIFWSFLYKLSRIILRNKSPEYCIRITSFIHGLFVAFVGINQCFYIDSPFDHPEWRTTRVQKFLMVVSLGYFLHDFGWILIYGDSKLMIVHHTYSILALCRMLLKGYSGGQATCALGSMEITNPLLQCRWYLRSEGYRHTILYASFEITFMFFFFLVRIVLGTYILIIICFLRKNEWEFKLMAVSIYIMSWIFFINIMRYMIVRYANLQYKLIEIQNKT